MLSQEQSFSRLCNLITRAPDDNETAIEMNELLNDLYTGYSELSILRAVARKLGRSTGGGNARQAERRRASGKHVQSRVGMSPEKDDTLEKSRSAEAGKASRLVVVASAGRSRPASYSG